MSELYLFTTITDRRSLSRFVSLYREIDLPISFIALGHGTVTGERASYFIDSAEKAVVFSVVTLEYWRRAKRGLRRSLQIDAPGVGVAFIVPLSSIGGRRELAFLTDGQNFIRGEESAMTGTERELLIIISNQGYNEMVMDAARAAGAHGGTVIHARGTGMERAEKFLGISLASEKDMTFIVSRTAEKDRIMQSVMLKAGMNTPAKSIIFSLPVSDTAGLRLLDADDDSDAAAAPAAGSAAAPAEAAAAPGKKSGPPD